MSAHDEWIKAANRLCGRFELETKQALRSLDPWVKAAECMIKAWDNRSCQPRAHGRKPALPPATWKEFCRRAVRDLSTAAKRPGRGTWEYWAALRGAMRCRYVRKSARG